AIRSQSAAAPAGGTGKSAPRRQSPLEMTSRSFDTRPGRMAIGVGSAEPPQQVPDDAPASIAIGPRSVRQVERILQTTDLLKRQGQLEIVRRRVPSPAIGLKKSVLQALNPAPAETYARLLRFQIRHHVQ